MKIIEHCPICGNNKLKAHATVRDHTVSKELFPVQTCDDCGLGITSPRPDDEDLEKYYLSDDYVSHSSNARNPLDKAYFIARSIMLRRKLRIVQKYAIGKSLLDYGCGTGTFLNYMQGHGYNSAGVEPSKNARQYLQANYPELSVSPTLQQERHFDVVTLWHVLEHIPDLNEIIEKLRTVMKPSATLIIAVPNVNSWDSAHYGNSWAAFDTPRHLWHFSQTSIKKLLLHHQLKLVTVLPMYLDAFYISLLSEKYNNHNKINIPGLARTLFNGLRSNIHATKTGEYSSLIYIVQHEV